MVLTLLALGSVLAGSATEIGTDMYSKVQVYAEELRREIEAEKTNLRRAMVH